MERIPKIVARRPRKDGKLELIALMALIDLFLALFRGGDRHDDEE